MIDSIYPGLRKGIIALTIILALAIPTILIEALVPQMPNPRFEGISRRSSGTPIAGAREETNTSLPEAPSFPKQAATPTPRLSASLFLDAYVDGIAPLSGGRSMIRIVLKSPVRGLYRVEAGEFLLRGYECFVPEAYDNRLYCFGHKVPEGRTIRILVYEVRGGEEALVFEVDYYVETLPIRDSTTSKESLGSPTSVTATPTPVPSPTITLSPSGTPTSSATQADTPTSQVPTLTATLSLSPSPTPTSTSPLSSMTPSPTYTLSPTLTSTPSTTDTPKPSNTPKPTNTHRPP